MNSVQNVEKIYLEFDDYMGIVARKLDFVACDKQRHRPACASKQSGQPLFYSLMGKYNSPTGSMQNFNIQASLCG